MTEVFKISRKADNRLKCRCCHGWMRFHPTEKTPLLRSNPPHAGLCVGCWEKKRTIEDNYAEFHFMGEY